MSKVAEENIWWPSCTMNQTVVKLGNDLKHEMPEDATPEIVHTYVLQQTKYLIIWACMCGRELSRYKYPRGEHSDHGVEHTSRR